MKKTFLLSVIVTASCLYAQGQKKANGTLYIEHPAIKVMEEFIKATVKGDSAAIAAFLTEDFKGYDGVGLESDSAMGKKEFISNVLMYSRSCDYFDIVPLPGSYPDAIEYQKDNKDAEVWVQTWSVFKGVHKRSGVKLNANAHFQFRCTKDNKLKTFVGYNNSSVLDKVSEARSVRSNGTIYNQHPNINTVRKSMYAFEKGDIEKALADYDESAEFQDINKPWGTVSTKAQATASWKKFHVDYEIVNIEMVGYPDYLEYEIAAGKDVLSWWRFHLIRKSDKKKIDLFYFFINGFNEKGKIISESTYYSDAVLKAK